MPLRASVRPDSPAASTLTKFFMAVPDTSTSAPAALKAVARAAMFCVEKPEAFINGPMRVKIWSISPASAFISLLRALMTFAVWRDCSAVRPMAACHVASDLPACSALTPQAMDIFVACSATPSISSRVLPRPAWAAAVMMATTSSKLLPVRLDMACASANSCCMTSSGASMTLRRSANTSSALTASLTGMAAVAPTAAVPSNRLCSSCRSACRARVLAIWVWRAERAALA